MYLILIGRQQEIVFRSELSGLDRNTKSTKPNSHIAASVNSGAAPGDDPQYTQTARGIGASPFGVSVDVTIFSEAFIFGSAAGSVFCFPVPAAKGERSVFSIFWEVSDRERRKRFARRLKEVGELSIRSPGCSSEWA